MRDPSTYHHHQAEPLTTRDKIRLIARRLCKRAIGKARSTLIVVDWRQLGKKACTVATLLLVVYLFSVWARGTTHSLFVPYTPYDTQRQVHREIAMAADAFFTEHPTEMCISSLELSATDKDQPFFHIILRSNMHHSYDGHFYNLLNPEYAPSHGSHGTTPNNKNTGLSRLHSAHHDHHHAHERRKENRKDHGSSTSTPAVPAAPASSAFFSRATTTTKVDDRQSLVTDDSAAYSRSSSSSSYGGSSPSESYLMRAFTHVVAKIPGSINDDGPAIPYTTNHEPLVSMDDFLARGIRWSSGLFPNQDVSTSKEWSLRREEKTYCDYVYYRKGNIMQSLVRWFWPGFALHPQKLPTQTIYRKKKVHIRYLDLIATKPVERTFEAEHAYCIQHYLDVFYKQWDC